MKFRTTELPGVIVVEPRVHRDDRGFLLPDVPAVGGDGWQGITINALVLDSAEDSLVPYFSRFVIGGPGAFVVAATPEAYAESLFWKRRVETAGLSAAELPRHVRVAPANGARDRPR